MPRWLTYEVATLPLPFALWYVTFRIPVFGFWPTLTLSASILLVVGLPRIWKLNYNLGLKELAIGIISAVAIYSFFWSGYQVAKSIPGFVQTISSVYGLRGGATTATIALVLAFPIGPAEELYWRGFIQRRFNEVIDSRSSLILTSVLYTLIHIPTLNPSLMFVALVGGIVWGAIYNKTGKIWPSIISHVIFDEFVFVLFVIS